MLVVLSPSGSRSRRGSKFRTIKRHHNVGSIMSVAAITGVLAVMIPAEAVWFGLQVFSVTVIAGVIFSKLAR